jgi:hypothetical protein
VAQGWVGELIESWGEYKGSSTVFAGIGHDCHEVPVAQVAPAKEKGNNRIQASNTFDFEPLLAALPAALPAAL